MTSENNKTSQKFISPDALSDGKVLVTLKKSYLEEKNENNLLALISCFSDSILLVPMNKGDENEKVSDMLPRIIKDKNGKNLLPVFSQDAQIPDEKKDEATYIPIEAMTCIEMAHSIENSSGIILDAFTEPVVFPFNVIDASYDIASRLRSENEEGEPAGYYLYHNHEHEHDHHHDHNHHHHHPHHQHHHCDESSCVHCKIDYDKK